MWRVAWEILDAIGSLAAAVIVWSYLFRARWILHYYSDEKLVEELRRRRMSPYA